MRYIVIGGNPIRSYTGTGTYTGLSVMFRTNSLLLIKENWKALYERSGGLISVIDTEADSDSNSEVNPDDFLSDLVEVANNSIGDINVRVFEQGSQLAKVIVSAPENICVEIERVNSK